LANNENLVPFDKRSESEVREYARKGGQASGKARRRKAEFRKTLNALLTAEIDNPEWKPFLESIGLDCTLESAMLAAQIRATPKPLTSWLSMQGRTGRQRRTSATRKQIQSLRKRGNRQSQVRMRRTRHLRSWMRY